jgi:hypothetical protein
MTPKEIVDNIAFCTSRVLSESDTKLAIEAIKQYAKDMCDKQRNECLKAYNEAPSVPFEYQAIQHAPYPSELS